MKWCVILNMWCDDIDEDDYAYIACDGVCLEGYSCEYLECVEH